jgi:hypothetical protein
VAWLLPLAGIAAGAVAVAVLAWRWSRTKDDGPGAGGGEAVDPALDPVLERRLDDELARFE